MSEHSPLLLRALHESLGAKFSSENDAEVVEDYGDVRGEHAALLDTAGVLDLSFRCRICLTGADRARFLHGQVTNDVKKLGAGQGCYSALTTAKGKIQSDLNIFALLDELLLDFEPGLTALVTQRLEKFIVADDVQIVDVTPHYGLFSVQGPKAEAVIRALTMFNEIPPQALDSAKVSDATLGDIYLMNHARLGVGLEGVAIAERAWQHALDYAKTRVQGRAIGQKGGDRVTIINHPDVRRMLLSMKSQVEAMRALAYTASAALDKAKHHPDDNERKRNQAYVDLLIPIVKGWCTEQAIEVASTGVQIHGGMGFIEATGVAQYLRDARITAIYEGTTGIQAADLVGRKIGYEKGATAAVVIAQMRKEASGLKQNSNADVAAQHDALVRSIDALAHATKWVVEHFQQDPNAVAAVSVPYLKLWGIVAGGWLMARAAEIAAAKLAAGAGDAAFCTTKIATARFYVEHILPQAPALAEEITGGAASVLAFDSAAF